MSSSSSVSFNGFDHTRQQVRAQQSSPAGSLSSSQSTARTSVSRLTSRQRQNSQLTSTIFQSPLVYPRMMNHLPMDVYADKTGETFFAEWPVQNAQALKAHIEDTPSSTWTLAAELENDEDWPRALKGGIVLGGGWYTIELARTYPHPHTRSSPVEEVAQTLAEEQRVIDTISLYISATSVQNNAIEIEYPATIFVGIKTTHTNTGAKYGETQYIWTSNTDFEFTKECEFHAIELPKISHLLQNPDVLKDDGFSICVHIASPMATKQSFTMPNEVTIPRRIIDSLASLVDSTTGDVKFLCLEHVLMPISPNPFGEDSGVLGEKVLGETHHLVSRKRVLYAHSEILKASGDYFNGLLTCGFAESSDARRLDTNHVSIIVDDASFETVYWMLKFIYTNSLLFAENENVRLLTEHMQNDRGEARRRLTSHALPYSSHSEWEYSRLPKDGEDINDDDFDAKTIKSTSSVHSALSSTSSIMGAQGRPAQTPVGKVTSGIKGLNTSPSSGGVSKIPRLASPSSTPPRRRAGIQPSASLRMTKSPPTLASPPSAGALMSAVGSEVSPTRVPAPAFAPASSRSNKKASPSSTRNAYLPRGVLTQSDPHSHPCASPAPASALAVYMLSHRYSLDSLEELARDHILAKMTPGNCMPMLLATYRYDQLHAEVLDFVIDHWTDVQISIEFLKCVQEVSSGAWGEEGGLVLHGLFKRL